MLELRHRSIRTGHSTQDAYDDLFKTTDLRLRDSYYLWLMSLLQTTPDRSLLDISCGTGRVVQLAQKQGLDAVGLDFSREAVAYGAKGAPKARWLVGDGEILPFADSTIDYITHLGSLEHYERLRFGASEIARVLSPTGRAVILLPNAFGLLGNIKHVWKTGEIFDDGQPLQRYATLTTWRTLLEQGGLQIDEVIPWCEENRPRTVADYLWYARKPQKILKGALAQLIPLPLQNHFVFVCGKASTAERPARSKAVYMTLPQQ